MLRRQIERLEARQREWTTPEDRERDTVRMVDEDEPFDWRKVNEDAVTNPVAVTHDEEGNPLPSFDFAVPTSAQRPADFDVLSDVEMEQIGGRIPCAPGEGNIDGKRVPVVDVAVVRAAAKALYPMAVRCQTLVSILDEEPLSQDWRDAVAHMEEVIRLTQNALNRAIPEDVAEP